MSKEDILTRIFVVIFVFSIIMLGNIFFAALEIRKIALEEESRYKNESAHHYQG